MNSFKAAAGDSLAAAGLSVNDFRDKFLQLGAQLPVSTSAVQEAATTLIKGGLDPMVVKMGGLESSLKFAAAAGMDLNAAAELSIKQLGTFVPITASAADQTKFLADSQDLLVKAAGASTLDVDKLGDAMLGAGGAAKASGVGYQDFVTTMGLISPSFQSAATAGTSYKNFLTRLIPQTSDATGWMEKLGLYTSETGSKFFDATGKFVGNRQAAELLSKAFAGLSDAERSEAAAMIFGNDAKDAAIALAASGAVGYDKFADAMAKASGVEATAQTVQQGYNIALDNMHGSVEALQIVVGTALLPILTTLLNGVVSPGINLVTAFAQAMIGSSDAFATLPGVLQTVVMFFGDLWVAGDLLITAFDEGGTLSIQFAAALAQLGTALGLPASLLPAISFALQGFVASIWPAVEAIAAFVMGTGDLGTVADLLIDLFGVTIGGLITDAIQVLDSYATVWIDLGTTIYNVVAALTGGDLAGAWAALTSGIAQVVTDYQTYAASLGALLASIGDTIVAAIVTYAPIIWQQFLTWGQGLIDWITPYIPLVLETLNTWIASIWTWIQTQAPIWLAQLATWGAALVDWATPYLALALTTLNTWVAGLWAWVQQQAPIWLTQLAAWGAALVDWIAPYIPLVLAAIGNLATSLWAWIQEQAAPLIAQFGAWANAFVAWIPGATVQFLAAWPGMLGGFLDWIAGAVGPILAQLGQWALAFVQWIGPALPGILAGLGAVLGVLVAFIVETAAVLISKLVAWGAAFLDWIGANVLPALPGLLLNIGAAILAFIAGAIAGIAAGVAGWVGAFLNWVGGVTGQLPGILDKIRATIAGWISGAASGLASAAASIGTNIVDGIKQGLIAKWESIKSWMSEKLKGLLGTAQGAIDAHSPSRLFMKEVGVPIVDGIVAGISQASPKATTAILELAGKLVDVVGKGVDAFGKLRTLGEIPNSAIATFSASLNTALRAFADMAASWDKASISWASQFQAKAAQVVDTLAKGVDFLAKLRELGPVAPGAADTLAAGIDAAMRAIVAISTRQTLIALAGAQSFAKVAGEILGILKTGVDALAALQNLTDPPAGSIQKFAQLAGYLVLRFGQIGQTMQGPALGAASLFGEGAGKVLGILKSGVDGLTALNDLADPIPGVFQTFAQQIGYLVLRMSQVAAALGQDAVAAAAKFAESAGKVLGILKSGVEGLAALRAVPLVSQEAFGSFAYGIDQAIVALIQVADDVSQAGVEAAAKFAESAGKVLAILKTGVEGLTALVDVPLVSQEAFGSFAYGIDQAIVALIQVADDVSQGAVEAAAKFAESAGKVLAILKTGVEGLAALRDLGPVSGAAIAAFAAAINQTMVALGAAASQFSAEAIAQAGKFAEAAGKAVGILKTGVEGLLIVDTFTGVSGAAIDRFGEGVRLAVAKMAELANLFGADAVEAARVFAVAAGESTDFLKKGVDGLAKLEKYNGVTQQALDRFAAGIVAMVATIIRLSAILTTDTLTQANAFANAIDTVITVVESGLKALGNLGSDTDNVKAFADMLVAQVDRIAAALATQAKPAATSIGTNIAIGIANGITAAAPAIWNAVVAAVTAALAAARQALGIASPSKAFATIGRQAGAGLTGGMDASIAPAEAAGARLAAASLIGAAGGLPTPRASLPPGGSPPSVTLQIAPGAVVVHAAATQSPAQVADMTVATLARRARGLLPTN